MKDLALEGHLSPALELSFPETQVNGGVIAESNPNVRSEKGIGVGSTVAQLRSSCQVTGVGSGEGAVFVMVAELSASFKLDYRPESVAKVPPYGVTRF